MSDPFDGYIFSSNRVYRISGNQTVDSFYMDNSNLVEIPASRQQIKNDELGTLCNLKENQFITAVCLIVQKNQLVFGRSDGAIIIVNALKAVESTLFSTTEVFFYFLEKERKV